MVRGFTAIVMLVATLAVGAAPQLKEKPGANPLLGRWRVTETYVRGGPLHLSRGPVEYCFAMDGKLTEGQHGFDWELKYSYDGRRLTIWDPEASNNSRRYCIFELQDDKLVIARRIDDGLPKEIDNRNRDCIVLYFTRVSEYRNQQGHR